ncbi:MAG: hypothetical protein KA354_06355 [Phycisphaerae bacterium]|nr:hypothetical protein [Phycisphaerae bacterium]
MFRILRSFFDIWRPTPERVIHDIWGVEESSVDQLLSGRLDLGTFVYAGLGYTEDTWPLVIVGQFSRIASEGRRSRSYDFRHHRGRMVIDFESRSAWVQAGWSKRRLFAADIRWDISALEASTLRGSGCEWQLQLLTDPGRWRLAVTITEAPFLLESIAARINHLWTHGRDTASRLAQLGEWGSLRGYRDRWKNPDSRLIDELRALGRVAAKAG